MDKYEAPANEHTQMMHLEQYEASRRKLLALMAAQQCLSQENQSRFKKPHRVFKTIQGLCYNEAINRIRLLADNSACLYADRVGDKMFSKEVDNVHLPGPTHWFAGLADQTPMQPFAIPGV